jgi:hypothetical protein
MTDWIGSLVKDADDLDRIARIPVVHDMVFDETNPTAGEEFRP